MRSPENIQLLRMVHKEEEHNTIGTMCVWVLETCPASNICCTGVTFFFVLEQAMEVTQQVLAVGIPELASHMLTLASCGHLLLPTVGVVSSCQAY